jgi:transposase
MAKLLRQYAALPIAKLERQLYGPRSERSSQLIDQMALQFEELEASATEDELAAEIAVAKVTTVAGFTRKRPERNTFPEHLPRERVVVVPPIACDCCGGKRLRKLGEDVTKTLESIPRRWKVIETVREKFTCRAFDYTALEEAMAHLDAIVRTTRFTLRSILDGTHGAAVNPSPNRAEPAPEC